MKWRHQPTPQRFGLIKDGGMRRLNGETGGGKRARRWEGERKEGKCARLTKERNGTGWEKEGKEKSM